VIHAATQKRTLMRAARRLVVGIMVGVFAFGPILVLSSCAADFGCGGWLQRVTVKRRRRAGVGRPPFPAVLRFLNLIRSFTPSSTRSTTASCSWDPIFAPSLINHAFRKMCDISDEFIRETRPTMRDFVTHVWGKKRP
jgi:hypothetical protein